MGKDGDLRNSPSSELGQVLLRAVEQSPSIVLITDLKGIVAYANPKFCALTGYAEEEVLNKNIRFLKSGQMSPEFYATLWAEIRENDEWRGELHNRKKSGELYWESAVISAIRNADGIVEYYLKVAEDITRLKEAERERDRLMSEMKVMAMQDALTGLYSRRMFDDELDRAWKTGERHNVQTGLLVIDIDYFKTFNDTYGHQVGDQILVEAAELIKSTARAGDVVCRYGGDEIVAILPMASLEATSHVGMRLLEAFRDHVFCRGSHDLKATASIGAAAGAGGSEPAHAALMRADQALYHAKRNGRNILAVSDPNTAPQLLLLGKAAEGEASGQAGHARKKPTVLVLSDDESIRASVSAALKSEAFTVSSAGTTKDAVQFVQDNPGGTDIVMLQAKFRRSDDSGPLRQIWRIDDTVSAVVIINPKAPGGNTAAPARQGSVGFVSEPLSEEELLPAIDQALKKRHYLIEERRYQRSLQHTVSKQSTRLQELLKSSREEQRPVAELMTVIFKAYERKTGEHCQRVEKIARILASEMNIAEKDREAIERGAFLHDIGKIGIPDAILNKKTPLTLDEWRTIRLHPQIGYDLLKEQPSLEDASRIVLEHHERYDGSGYPDGKKGSQICMGARLFALADAYDAMRADRAYAASVPPEEAASEISSGRGTLFDPDVVDSFLNCQDLIEAEVFAEPDNRGE